jgi:NAD(P)H-dependent FMN reductase
MKQGGSPMKINGRKPNIGIILGSNRPGRICPAIAEWAIKGLEDDKLHFGLIDLAEVHLPFLDEIDIPARHHYRNEHTLKWSATIGGYDGFVLVFPQYNWGYPAVLKNAMDYLYDEWAGKPVSIMCYGSHGGFQASLGMKLVTQGLNMYNMATNPSLDIKEDMFDESWHFKDIDAAFARYKQPLRALSAEFVDLLTE